MPGSFSPLLNISIARKNLPSSDPPLYAKICLQHIFITSSPPPCIQEIACVTNCPWMHIEYPILTNFKLAWPNELLNHTLIVADILTLKWIEISVVTFYPWA